MAELQSLKKLRGVGRLEEHATARHSLGYYNNVGVSAYYTYSCPIELEQLQSRIYHAVKAVVALHPSLSVTLVDEDKPGAYFAQLPSISFAKTVRFSACAGIFEEVTGPHRLDQILEDEHNVNFAPMTGDTPLWRLRITYDPDRSSQFVASFIYHHAIADGTSGLAFHRSLILELGRAAESKLPPSQQCIPVPLSNKLIPTLEVLHKLPLSPSFMVKSFWREYFAPHPSNLWTASLITSDPRRSRFRSITFSKEATSDLAGACRSNSTSVTAALQAMLAATLFAELPADRYSLLRVSGAVSLRRWLPRDIVDDMSIGTWVSRYLDQHSRPKIEDRSKNLARAYFSWDEARRIKQHITTDLDKGGKDSVVGLLRFAGDLHRFFSSMHGKPREESFEFSNIGVFSSETLPDMNGNGWTIGRVVFSQSADIVGAPFETSLVTGADGMLNIGFSWLEGVVDGSWMGLVISTYKKLIDDIVALHRTTLSDN